MASEAATVATVREVRAPNTSWAKMSRPGTSVPNGCPTEGSCSAGPEIARGSCGVSSEAESATSSTSPRRLNPVTSRGERRRRSGSVVWSRSGSTSRVTSTGAEVWALTAPSSGRGDGRGHRPWR